MAATARQIEFPEKLVQDQAERREGGGAYAELDVPVDVHATLTGVEDYDKRPEKGWGWIFTYEVETPSGNTVSFDDYLSFSDGARWKLLDTLAAHGFDVTEGINNVDPNEAVDTVVGARIDFPRNDAGEATSKYREIRWVFSLVEDVEEVVGEAVDVGPDEIGTDEAVTPEVL